MDSIEILEIVLFLCALCGVGMVIGSMFFIYKGIIKLEQACTDNILSVELINKAKIETKLPALGLFICGFMFVTTSIWFAKDYNKWTISGKFTTEEVLPNAATLVIKPHCEFQKEIAVDSEGSFEDYITSDHQGTFKATFTAADYKPKEILLTKGFLGSLKFRTKSAYILKSPEVKTLIQPDAEVIGKTEKNTNTKNKHLEIAFRDALTSNGGLEDENL